MALTDRPRPPSVAPVDLPGGLVRPAEQVVLALKPSAWFLPLVSLPWLIWLGVGLLAAWGLEAAGAVDLPMPELALAALLIALGRLGAALLQWLARYYVLTDRRILRVKGVLWVRVFECGLGRVQHTRLSLPLIQRLLGVGTILFATAGTAGGDINWLIIARPRDVHAVVGECVRRAQAADQAVS